MGFIQIENYDGEKGYLPQGRFAYRVAVLEEKKYLVNFNESEQDSVAYRIVREGEDTAIATVVKNKSLLEALEVKYYKDLEQRLEF